MSQSILKSYRKNKPSVYLLLFENGMKAVFKPNRSLQWQISALRAYHFSQLLGLKLVPPTTIRTIDGQTGTIQLFVEGFRATPSNLNKHLSSFQKQDIYLFQAILGERDFHSEHILLDQECKTPLLIDNEKNTLSLSLIQRGDFPYVSSPSEQIAVDWTLSEAINFPFHLSKSVKKVSSFKNDLESLRKKIKAKPEVIDAFSQNRDLDRVLALDNFENDTLYYILYKNTVWLKENMTYILYKDFAFSSPSKRTIKALKALSSKDLDFLNFRIKNICYQYFDKQKVNKIMSAVKISDKFLLYRRDMLLKDYKPIPPWFFPFM